MAIFCHWPVPPKLETGTIACQVYSLNRKIIYAAWARNFSALKPFFDA